MASCSALSAILLFNRRASASRIAFWRRHDEMWSSTMMLVSLAGANGSTTFTDESPSARAITVVGNTVVSNAVTLFGMNTGLFDGTGDYLTVPNNASLSVANETDKTIEAWIYLTATGRTHTIANKRDGTLAEEWSFSISPTNFLQFAAFNGGSGVAIILGTTAFSATTWYHVAAVRTGGQTWTTYIDGVQEGTVNESAQPQSNTNVIYIGRDGYNTGRDMQGRIAEFRYTNAARYTANFTPPSAPYPRG